MRRHLLALAGLVVLAVGIGAFLLDPASSRAGAAPGSTTLAPASTSTTLAPTTTTISPGKQLQLDEGKVLFNENCSTCHGVNAQGSVLAPNLRGVGAATVDLWVSSGWMPLATPTEQPIKKPAAFTPAETKAIANYVGSLGGGPPIPKVASGNLQEGFDLFALNCAPCHTITGAGDALSNGVTAPTLHGVAATQIAEAIRTGPGNMPRFGPGILSDDQVNSVVTYVTQSIQHPSNPGGVGLGGVGPVAEGYIGLFIGVGACVIIALWIGERTERDKDEGHGEDHEADTGVAHA